MTDAQWSIIVDTLTRAYPHARTPPETWSLYRERLAKLQPDAVLRAVDRWVVDGDRFPALAHLYALAVTEQTTEVFTRADDDARYAGRDLATRDECLVAFAEVRRLLAEGGTIGHGDTTRSR